MECPRCGDHCLCTSASEPAFVRLSVSDQIPSTRETKIGFIHSTSTRARNAGGTAVAEAEHANEQWRDEIASRVQAHRAKRKRHYDPEASMSLGFDSAVESESAVPENTVASFGPDTGFDQPDLDEPSHTFDVLAEENAEPSYEPPSPPPNIYDRMAARAAEARRMPAERDAEDNLIEFPKPATPQELFTEELAEPITPRILDVPDEPIEPEIAVTPHLASVCLDGPSELPQWAKDYEDEEYELVLPIQVAPIGPRLLCGIMDGVLVLTAAALFSLIVLSMAKFVPQGKAATAIAVLLPAMLWAVYHYVFLVFGGVTPGMLMAQLELSSFEGCAPLRRTRATRAAAMVLSCMSLGLGFAWAVVDEDSLGWHDRITRTYLRQS